MPQGQRRLAAVMFTDMVGFTALGQRNEVLSLAMVDQQRKLVRKVLPAYHGREIKTMGDAFLVEFPSALEAVRCAYEIQRVVKESNFSLPEDERVRLRIGVHLGDVVESEGDISGDAVNIASRIEPLAEDGGVSLSREVYNQVSNKFELKLSSLGMRQLKNVSNPVEIFRMVMPWDMRSIGEQSQLDSKRIAVLPFANMSPDPSDEYFADGLTDELISSLASMRKLTVIARTSIMKYKIAEKGASEIARELNVGALVEGSVRKAGNRVRVKVQLIDPASEGHLWAESYDRELNDIFAIQSDIAGRVANSLSIHLAGPELSRLGRKPTEDPQAYLLYLKGRHYWNERSDEGLKKAILYFEQAVGKDNTFAPGLAGLADCYAVMARNAQAEFEPSFRRAKEFAAKALDLDEGLAEAHASLANILSYYDHDWKAAEAEYRKAIDLKPNYPTAHQWYAHLLFPQLRFEEGQRELELALRLDPFSLVINHNFGSGFYYQRKFDLAIEQFNKTNDLDPTLLFASVGPVGLVQSYVQEGRYGEAIDEIEKLSKSSRGYRDLKLWKAYVLSATDKTEARRLMQEVEIDYQKNNTSPYLIGQVHFLLGETDIGFQWLRTAYDVHDGSIVWIAADVELDGVRADPRYVALLNKVGLGNLTRNSN